MTIAFQDYDNLAKGVAKWLARSDLGANIPDFIWLAECDIQNEIRFRLTDEIHTGTVAQDENFLKLPDDYVSASYLRFTSNDIGSIEVVSLERWDAMLRSDTGVQPQTATTSGLAVQPNRPRGGFVWGDRLYFAATTGEEPFQLFYKAGVRHLNSTNKTNLILEQYPQTLLYGALLHSAPFLGADERLGTWQGLYDRAIARTGISETNARLGHGPLRQRPDSATP